MKSKITLLLFAFQFTLIFSLSAQNFNTDPSGMDGGYSAPENDANIPCITSQQYEMIERRCRENINRLRISSSNSSNSTNNTTSLEWPLKAAPALHDCSYYHIAAYVDQDTLTGTIRDFNCGTNTYDGHKGTDIATWPFNFYKMDNDLVEVVAAASGTIIDKHDGEFDRNCTSNTLTANYAIIQHADGSYALYWHMKNGSVTTKAIGQTVTAGEHLGVVGSSGSSSGPHLHFEVWNGNTSATRRDPFAGSCNTLNNASWWAAQKPYKETGVIKATAHTTDIVLPGCPTTETLNESNVFQIPFQGPGLPAGYAKFYIFIRDEVSGLTADMKILNPNGSTYLNWTYNSPSDNKVRTWAWSKVLPSVPGTYTYQATYNGTTCSSTFEITTQTGIASFGQNNSIKIYPNPSNGKFYIETADSREKEIEIYNMIGEKVFVNTIRDIKSEINPDLQSGVYYYRVKDNSGYFSSGKIIIEQ